MDKCTDKRFEKMRPLYEFDLLSEEQQRAFEIHLMECDFCLKSVQELKDVARHVHFNPAVHETIEKIVKEDEASGRPADNAGGRVIAARKLKINIIRASLVMAVLIAVLVLKPWQIDIRPAGEAKAAENLIAIMYFENTADVSDSGRLGEILANLLITDLSESEYIQVISNQRLFDVSRILGIEEFKTLNRDLATRIAEHVDAKWMITGSILQQQPKMVITSQIINVKTGQVIASQRVVGKQGEDIFALADKLSVQVKIDLSLPVVAYREYDKMIADVTTTSLTAYRYYLDGIDHYYSYNMDQALDDFSKALRYDSAFAMAYYYLSLLCRYPESNDLIKKAVQYSEKAGRKEQYLIKIQDAALAGQIGAAMSQLLQLIDDYPLEKYPHYLIAAYYNNQLKLDYAVRHLQIAIKLDPLYADAYNLLAYCYIDMDEKEKALQAVNKYSELKAGEINSYDSMADIYAKCGRHERAIELYRKVLSIEPSFADSRYKLANIYLYLGELPKADSAYKEFTSVGGSANETAYQLYKSYILLQQGKADQAIRELNYGIAIAEKETQDRWENGIGGLMRLLKFRVLNELGHDELLSRFENCSEIKDDYQSTYYQAYLILYIELLAEKGLYAKSETALNKLAQYLETNEKTLHSFWYCKGFIEFAKNNYNNSLSYFGDAALMNTDFLVNFRLTQANVEANRRGDAIAGYEKLIGDYRLWNPLWSWLRVTSHYHLGVAYEKMGRTEKAAKCYEEFLRIWKDADEGLKQKYGFDELWDKIARLKGQG